MPTGVGATPASPNAFQISAPCTYSPRVQVVSLPTVSDESTYGGAMKSVTVTAASLTAACQGNSPSTKVVLAKHVWKCLYFFPRYLAEFPCTSGNALPTLASFQWPLYSVK